MRIKLLYLFALLLPTSLFAQLVHLGASGGTQSNPASSAGPVNIFYESLHAQFLYTSAELIAAGVSGGQDITELGFFIVSTPNLPLPNYTIKLKNTTATTTTVYDGTGLTTVYTNSSYAPVAGGFDMLTLSAPFTWSGDNLLVDVCFEPVSTWSSSGVVRTYNATNQFRYIRQDGTNTCPSTTNANATYKPQIQLNFTNPNPMVYDSLSVNHPTNLPVFIGTPDAQILNVKVYTTGGLSPLTATQFVLNMTGTTNVADILSAKLYYTGSSNGFSNATQVGSTINSPSGALTFNDNITLQPGVSNFWLVYDVSASATPGNFIDAQLTSVVVDGTPRTPTNGDPLGNRQIVDPYANIPFFEGFEGTWINGAAVRDIPSVYWVNTPSSTDSSWRRSNDGASAGWGAPNSGAYSPQGSNAAGGSSSFSARFHSYNVNSGRRGKLDLYLNFSPVGNKLLNFDYINTSGTDNLTILLSTDGGQTFPTIIGTYNTATTWQRFENILLTNSISPTCVLRFQARGDFGVTDIGLDNVKIRIPSPNDIQMVSMSSPTSGCGLGNETVTVLIRNIGTVVQTGFNVGFLLNGVPFTENVGSFFVNPGQTKSYTFTTLANLSVPGTYEIRPFTDLSNDGDRTNDTLPSIFIESKPTVTSYPYIEDFENGQGGWVAGGNFSSWAFGTPNKTVINSAGSGVNSWVTGGLGTGTYNSSENSFVLGPCFDFSTLVNPVISLKINYHSETSWDGAVLQSSINNGATWQRVGNLGDPNNWYNDGTINGNPGGQQVGWSGAFASGSGGWIVARNKLTGLGGQPSVLLRIAFGADASINYEGFAFDDIVIQEGPVLNLVSPLVICSGDTLTLDAGNFATYLWSTTETTRYIDITAPGFYIVRVTDGLGFSVQDTVEVLGNNLQLELGSNLFRCPGDTATFTANITNVSYLWSTGDTTETITVSSPGTYTLQITDNFGCIKTDTVALVNLPEPNFILGNDTSFCAGGFVEINASANLSGSSYLWNNGATTPRLVVTAPGSYSVIVTAPNGCTATDTINVALEYRPSVNLGPDLTLCQNNSVVLNASNPNSTYLWSTGATTPTITVNTPGTYSVIVTGPTGCEASDTMSFANFSPALVEIGPSVTSCGSTELSVIPQPGMAYLWSNGAQGSSVIVTQSGTYVVQAVTSDGCVAYDTTDVTILPAVKAQIGGLDTVYVNVPAQFVDASFPVPNSWVWDFGNGFGATSQNPVHTFTSEGTFLVTLVSSNGFCNDTATKLITVVQEPQVSVENWKDLLSFQFYPNPNQGRFVLKAEFANSQDVKLQIFNSIGQEVTHFDYQNTKLLNEKIELSDVSAGVYTIKLQSGKGVAFLKMVIF